MRESALGEVGAAVGSSAGSVGWVGWNNGVATVVTALIRAYFWSGSGHSPPIKESPHSVGSAASQSSALWWARRAIVYFVELALGLTVALELDCDVGSPRWTLLYLVASMFVGVAETVEQVWDAREQVRLGLLQQDRGRQQ